MNINLPLNIVGITNRRECHITKLFYPLLQVDDRIHSFNEALKAQILKNLGLNIIFFLIMKIIC